MMKIIAGKVERGERLTDADALWLYEKADLVELGSLANRVNLNKNGAAVFYNVNRHINPTNICALSCKFCAYSKKIGEDGGYAYEIDEMIAKAGEAIAQGATELHMVGGLHPRWPFQRYVDMIAALRKTYPQVHLKAFTAVELDWMARRSRKTIRDVMLELKNAGLDSFPGGGAEIFHPEIRDQICDTKVSAEQWIDTHRTAHSLGLRSNCTMLYGHIENYGHRVDHMRRLRELQDETSGFNVFIPLAFQPFQNEMGIHRYTFGADDLRTIAIARLYLDNFKNIKSYWVMLGQDIAQLALQFGANDLDGTVLEEKISRAAGGRAGMIMTRTNLEQLIRRSGRIPVERTTLYQPVNPEALIHLTPVKIDASLCAETDSLRELIKKPTCLSSDELRVSAEQTSLHAAGALLREFYPDGNAASQTNPSIFITLSSEDATLAELQKHTSAMDVPVANTETPGQEAVVIGCENCNDYGLLASIVSRIKAVAPRRSIYLHGISWCVDLTATQNVSLISLLSELKSCGLDGVLESAADAESLHSLDRKAIHRAARELGLNVVTSIILREINGSADWSFWAEQVGSALADQAFDETCPAITLRVGVKSSIMPTEYLKALALTRLVTPNYWKIWTPLEGIYTLSPQQGLGVSVDHHPVTKIVSALTSFGSTGLGYLFANKFNSMRVMQDLSGYERNTTNPVNNGEINRIGDESTYQVGSMSINVKSSTKGPSLSSH